MALIYFQPYSKIPIDDYTKNGGPGEAWPDFYGVFTKVFADLN